MINIPALRGLGATFAVKDDAGQRLGHQAADETAAVPLRKSLRSRVEHQVTWRNHRNPINNRQRKIRLRVWFGNGHAVIVVTKGNYRPPIISALLDQVQFV